MSAGRCRNDVAGGECSPGERTDSPVDGAGVFREVSDDSAKGEAEHPPPLAEGVFHLISAHEVAPNLYPAAYVAVCGEKVETSSMAGTDCPNECEGGFSGTMAYCPACLRAAIRQNRRAGVDAGAGGVGIPSRR